MRKERFFSKGKFRRHDLLRNQAADTGGGDASGDPLRQLLHAAAGAGGSLAKQSFRQRQRRKRGGFRKGRIRPQHGAARKTGSRQAGPRGVRPLAGTGRLPGRLRRIRRCGSGKTGDRYDPRTAACDRVAQRLGGADHLSSGRSRRRVVRNARRQPGGQDHGVSPFRPLFPARDVGGTDASGPAVQGGAGAPSFRSTDWMSPIRTASPSGVCSGRSSGITRCPSSVWPTGDSRDSRATPGPG